MCGVGRPGGIALHRGGQPLRGHDSDVAIVDLESIFESVEGQLAVIVHVTAHARDREDHTQPMRTRRNARPRLRVDLLAEAQRLEGDLLTPAACVGVEVRASLLAAPSVGLAQRDWFARHPKPAQEVRRLRYWRVVRWLSLWYTTGTWSARHLRVSVESLGWRSFCLRTDHPERTHSRRRWPAN